MTWRSPGELHPAAGAPDEVDDGDDRTSRVLPPFTIEAPALAADTSPGHLHRAPARDTRASPLEEAVPEAPPEASADTLIGAHCGGGYVIQSLLGEGGMGRVYLARHPRMGKRVAVKIVLAEHSRNPRNVDRFFQEAKAAAQIDDPNIVEVLDAAELPDGRAYLLMPYVEGTSLEELCERMGPLPLDVAATILLQICGGLDAAHGHGIIHRDIKPQNILVGPRHQREHFVRIADFGIAKLLDPHLAGKFRTHTKVMMGTPGYMAPEQARGERDIDGRADVYAVAVVAYRMLTGRRPYLEEALLPWLQKQGTNAPFPRPRELRPDLPAEWDEAIMAALAHDRNQRLATVHELALRLARGLPEGEAMLRLLVPRLAKTQRPPHAPPFAPEAAPRPRAYRGEVVRRVLTGAAALLLSVGVGALWARSTKEKRPAAAAVSTNPASSTNPAPSTNPTTNPTPVPGSEPAALPVSASPTPKPAPTPDTTAPTAAIPSSPVAVAQASSPTAPATVTPAAAPPPHASPPPKAASPPAAAAPAKAPGSLVLDVVPWAYVWIDGKRVGDTPFRGQLSPGRHQVRIKNTHQEKTLTITISSSRTTVVDESLEGPPP